MNIKKTIEIEVEAKDINWLRLANKIKRCIQKEIWVENGSVKVNIKEDNLNG